jgi:hypothetical protein
MNGVNGYIVRGRGDYASRSIFLPCAGNGDGTSLYDAGSYGYCWSSVPYSDDYGGFYAWYLYFYSSRHSTTFRIRYRGCSVRPVQGVSCVAVTFDACGGSSVDSIFIPLGQAIGELPVPTRNGYTFVGWFTAQEGGEAVTRLIRMAAEGIHASGEGKWLGICGEMAADSKLTEQLISLGADELSVSPPYIARVKERIREID